VLDTENVSEALLVGVADMLADIVSDGDWLTVPEGDPDAVSELVRVIVSLSDRESDTEALTETEPVNVHVSDAEVDTDRDIDGVAEVEGELLAVVLGELVIDSDTEDEAVKDVDVDAEMETETLEDLLGVGGGVIVGETVAFSLTVSLKVCDVERDGDVEVEGVSVFEVDEERVGVGGGVMVDVVVCDILSLSDDVADVDGEALCEMDGDAERDKDSVSDQLDERVGVGGGVMVDVNVTDPLLDSSPLNDRVGVGGGVIVAVSDALTDGDGEGVEDRLGEDEQLSVVEVDRNVVSEMVVDKETCPDAVVDGVALSFNDSELEGTEETDRVIEWFVKRVTLPLSEAPLMVGTSVSVVVGVLVGSSESDAVGSRESVDVPDLVCRVLVITRLGVYELLWLALPVEEFVSVPMTAVDVGVGEADLVRLKELDALVETLPESVGDEDLEGLSVAVGVFDDDHVVETVDERDVECEKLSVALVEPETLCERDGVLTCVEVGEGVADVDGVPDTDGDSDRDADDEMLEEALELFEVDREGEDDRDAVHELEDDWLWVLEPLNVGDPDGDNDGELDELGELELEGEVLVVELNV
jgi:hypothetical protein